MHWSSDGIGGCIVYWIKHKRFYLGITFLGDRAASPYITVSNALPEGAVLRNSDNTPSVVIARYKQATHMDVPLKHGQLIRVNKNVE